MFSANTNGNELIIPFKIDERHNIRLYNNIYNITHLNETIVKLF